MRELMALNRILTAAGRQTIFLGTTEPRAARPESPAAERRQVGQDGLAVSTVGKKSLH